MPKVPRLQQKESNPQLRGWWRPVWLVYGWIFWSGENEYIQMLHAGWHTATDDLMVPQNWWAINVTWWYPKIWWKTCQQFPYELLFFGRFQQYHEIKWFPENRRLCAIARAVSTPHLLLPSTPCLGNRLLRPIASRVWWLFHSQFPGAAPQQRELSGGRRTARRLPAWDLLGGELLGYFWWIVDVCFEFF